MFVTNILLGILESGFYPTNNDIYGDLQDYGLE